MQLRKCHRHHQTFSNITTDITTINKRIFLQLRVCLIAWFCRATELDFRGRWRKRSHYYYYCYYYYYYYNDVTIPNNIIIKATITLLPSMTIHHHKKNIYIYNATGSVCAKQRENPIVQSKNQFNLLTDQNFM